jgi:glutamyl-tRNA reductase
MPLHAIGLNHQSAPIALRERVAFEGERLASALVALKAQPGVHEIAVLSTCNRTEVYAVTDTHTSPVAEWLATHAAGSSDLHDYLYTHGDAEAARHLFRVATGLDSMILGEPQILGQVKQCWSEAKSAGTLGPHLDRLFQHAFATAKRARTETAVGNSSVSVAASAVKLSRESFVRPQDAAILLVGAGETIELVARHLQATKPKALMFANRTLAHAQNLASQYGGIALPLEELPRHLDAADVVFSATASQLPIIQRAHVEAALKTRRHRPMLFMDLAVPRDVSADVAQLKDAFVYTVDDLHRVVEENVQTRRDAASAADAIIDLQVARYMEMLALNTHGKEAVRKIRAHGARAREEAVSRAKSQLAAGHPSEAVIEQLAHALTNKLMHAPTTAIRQAAIQGDAELVRAAGILFPNDDTDDATGTPPQT